MKQGASTSPVLFNLVIDQLIMELKLRNIDYKVQEVWLGSFTFADDLLLITTTYEEAEQMMEIVSYWAELFNLRVNMKKLRSWPNKIVR